MKKNRHRFSVSLSAITVLSVTAAVIAAVSVCIVIFSAVYSRALLRDASVSSEQAVSQAALSVNSYFESAKHKLSLLRSVIENSASAREAEEGLSVLTFIQNDIYAVTVYSENGEIISCTGSGSKRKASVYKDLSFDRELFESNGSFSVSRPHVQTLFEDEYPWVVTVSAVSDAPILGTGKYISVDFNFSEIARFIDNIGVGRQGYCFITDRSGEIIYHPQQQLLFSGLKSENTGYIESLPDGVTSLKNSIYALKTTDNDAWRIVGISFTDDLTAERNMQIMASIAFSALFCALIILLVLLLYSKTVNRPVKSLIQAMESFENNGKDFADSNSSSDVSVNGSGGIAVLNSDAAAVIGNGLVKDLDTLSSSFGHMSERIKQLMEHIRLEEKELRKTELKALQAQINPHFLYNTLDSVQWMCELGKTEDAAKMVSSLAKLFRISISRGKELIPIKDELLHAKNYLIIQSFRYRDQFTYRFDVDPELEHYLCNKITIQPLIENSIYHGIDRLVDEGEIIISVRQAPDSEDDIIISVADNGVGMSPEQCRAILSKEHSDSHGIGVKNVNDRLRIYFGERYGISIESELDAGTTVMVRIPKLTHDKEDGEENEKA